VSLTWESPQIITGPDSQLYWFDRIDAHGAAWFRDPLIGIEIASAPRLECGEERGDAPAYVERGHDAVPEPGTAVMLATGLVVLMLIRLLIWRE
jgi:hypothetical protein